MSYARSPRPVCSMTMGTKLAFMGADFCSRSVEILPALLWTGNIFGGRLHGDDGLGQHQLERPLATQAIAQRLPCFGTLVEGPDPLRRLLLAPRECVNFGVKRRVVD